MANSKKPPATPEAAVLRAALDDGLAPHWSLRAASGERGTVRLRLALAYSGGCDSSVLLHLLAATPGLDVLALHIHHGLSANADAWLHHCAAQCAALGVAFDQVRLNLVPERGASIEAAAREARYAALHTLCARHGIDLLLTAHHAGDQAETVLLNLLRGSGVAGLAGMRALRPRGGLNVLRPLLACDPELIRRHARQQGIAAIEDESNRDTRFARNALRHQLLPVLRAIEPTVLERLGRTAAHAAEAQALLDDIAAADLAACQCGEASAGATVPLPAGHCTPGASLPARPLHLATFNALPPARAANALRAWLRQQGLHAPTTPVLREMLLQCRHAEGATALHIEHDGMALRAWRGCLHIENIDTVAGGALTLHWQGESVLDVPAWQGQLLITPTPSRGVPADWLRAQALRIVPRSGGERFKPDFGRPSKSLKNIYQEQGIPPWQRSRLPLLYAGDTLLLAGGLGMDARCLQPHATADVPLVTLHWQGREAAPGSTLGEVSALSELNTLSALSAALPPAA